MNETRRTSFSSVQFSSVALSTACKSTQAVHGQLVAYVHHNVIIYTAKHTI